jgi:nitrous oxide reductase accessory protein NosL
MKKYLLALALSAALLTGCAARQSTITNLPVGVTQAQVQGWDSAVANLNKIAVANSGLRQAVIGLHNTNVFPSGSAYITTLTIIGKIDQIENAGTVYLQGVPKDWSVPTQTKIKDYMQQISALLQQLNSQGITGIKNASSQQQINTLISEITSSVTLILSL